MFKFPRMKLYRKFLILAVMLASLFALSSASRVGATPCCDYCEALYQSCINTCAAGPPESYESCAWYGCQVDYFQCGGFCQDDYGALGCNHPE